MAVVAKKAEQVCKGCKITFLPKRSHQVFHSVACRKAYWKRWMKRLYNFVRDEVA
jgi:hypothetical protein